MSKKNKLRGAPFPRKCITKYCKGIVTKTTKGWICPKCRSRINKQNHPLRYRFNLLRCGAKRRGIEFKLTFNRYEELAKESGLHNNRGKTSDSLSIDRIDPKRGYEDDNVRVVTIAWNSRLNYVPYWRNYIEEIKAAAKLNCEQSIETA